MNSDFARVSKLGFGCMRLPQTDPKDPTAIDIEHVKQMVDTYLAGGGNYFDTAFVYHNGASEKALGEALVARHPRESYTIATKCLAWACPDEKTAKSNLPTSLERLGTDYIDFYLLHNVGGKRTKVFDDWGMWDFAQKAKQDGLIRHVGFSMHDGPETLDRVLTDHPEMEFVQLQVNYLDWESPVTQSRRCMEVAAEHDVPVIIMEPARGGMLVNLADRVAAPLVACSPEKSLASWAYRFCYNLPGVLTVLSGMSTIDQVRQNIADFKANEPFSPAETEALAQTREGVPAGSRHPRDHGAFEPRGAGREQQVRERLVQLAGEARSRLRLHRVRPVRVDVPAADRHYRELEDRRRALRVRSSGLWVRLGPDALPAACSGAAPRLFTPVTKM